MRERGLATDHVTVFRGLLRYAPEINERLRPHLKMSGTSLRRPGSSQWAAFVPTCFSVTQLQEERS